MCIKPKPIGFLTARRGAQRENQWASIIFIGCEGKFKSHWFYKVSGEAMVGVRNPMGFDYFSLGVRGSAKAIGFIRHLGRPW